jgi:hypothetical protein
MTMLQMLILILLLALVVIFAPLLTIWSLNTLFGLSIGYTFFTWAATVWLQMSVFGGAVAAKQGGK